MNLFDDQLIHCRVLTFRKNCYQIFLGDTGGVQMGKIKKKEKKKEMYADTDTLFQSWTPGGIQSL
jgi:hypothetical protein